MIDKHTGRTIISPADRLANQDTLMQKILSLKLTASQTEAVINALLARQNYLETLQQTILNMSATKAMAVLAAVGIEGSELKALAFGPNQIQELRLVAQDRIPNSIRRAEDLDRQ